MCATGLLASCVRTRAIHTLCSFWGAHELAANRRPAPTSTKQFQTGHQYQRIQQHTVAEVRWYGGGSIDA
jgi:hypothetical protein